MEHCAIVEQKRNTSGTLNHFFEPLLNHYRTGNRAPMTSIRQLAETLQTNHTKLSRIIKRLELTGTLKLDPIQSGQSHDLTEDQIAIISS